MNDLMQRFHFERNQGVLEKLVKYIETSDDAGLFHINVYGLAEQWNVDKKVLLELFIRGLHEGIFTMEWVYHCPHCGGIAHETLTLHQAKTTDYCPLCKVDFTNTLDNNIEVFFSIHPEIKNISKELKENYIKSAMEEITDHKMFQWSTPLSIKGVDIIQHPVYRELFPDEVLLPDQSLELMKATILFTDIKGSTQMYTDLGDSKAFLLVREHFRILFEVIKKFNGVPIKTIGDAVMGVFTNQTDGLTAALEAQKALIEYYKDRPEPEKIEVKIGLHSGPTIVVTLNGRLDYFGSTVNMAARIQAIANPNEVVMSENIFEHEESKKILAQYAKTVERTKRIFKGLKGEYNIYSILVK
ncbi:adenylate/guanylate cyclase domain-containing protein [Thermospira aquatica]|uniref:Adenylate/guanylate cyclase domain-containing protein n=1 Tax=Thermospira aquatica TaxID=2828656 RepID=A0AAX3BDM0_9SPIR|nr:adenylate/guanylate cyclase domain-containing protein [Thermospira aquatica]URA10316.1 adenylate/guanylate cyclase domain-containing protein [Thermospira aquatica]